MKKSFKSLHVIAIALALVIGLASAGLLQFYGMITGKVNVTQSVRLYDPDKDQWMQCTGGDYDACTYNWNIGNIVAGSSGEKIFTLGNFAHSSAIVRYKVNVTPANQGVVASITGVEVMKKGDVLVPVCSGLVSVPTEIPAATDTGPGEVQFCVVYASDLATIPTTYTITVGIQPED